MAKNKNGGRFNDDYDEDEYKENKKIKQKDEMRRKEKRMKNALKSKNYEYFSEDD